jgi:hypothetical protein
VETALTLAVRRGHAGVVHALLCRGADVSPLDVHAALVAAASHRGSGSMLWVLVAAYIWRRLACGAALPTWTLSAIFALASILFATVLAG